MLYESGSKSNKRQFCHNFLISLWIPNRELNISYLIRIETDKTLIVKDQRFPVNCQYLAAFSPVFAAMFQTDMLEKKKSEIEIKSVYSSKHFADFLDAFSPEAEQILPNRND